MAKRSSAPSCCELLSPIARAHVAFGSCYAHGPVFLTDGAACWCYLRIDYGFTNVKVIEGGCVAYLAQ